MMFKEFDVMKYI